MHFKIPVVNLSRRALQRRLKRVLLHCVLPEPLQPLLKLLTVLIRPAFRLKGKWLLGLSGKRPLSVEPEHLSLPQHLLLFFSPLQLSEL